MKVVINAGKLRIFSAIFDHYLRSLNEPPKITSFYCSHLHFSQSIFIYSCKMQQYLNHHISFVNQYVAWREQIFNIYMEDSHGQFVLHRNDASNRIRRGVPNDRK